MDLLTATGIQPSVRMSSSRRRSIEDGDSDANSIGQGNTHSFQASELPSNPTEDELLTLLVTLASDFQKDLPVPDGSLLSRICKNDVGLVNIHSTSIGAGSSFNVRAMRMHSSEAGAGCLVFKSAKPSRRKYTEEDERRRLTDILLDLRTMCNVSLRQQQHVVKLLGLGWETEASPDPFKSRKKWPVMILEYADCGTLRDWLGRERQLTYSDKGNVCMDILEAVAGLHAMGFVHGDLKLENILVFTHDSHVQEERNRRWIAKLGDFGGTIEGDIKQEDVRTHALRTGTPPWNAPEWKKKLPIYDLSLTDVYSVGFVIWRVMAGGVDPFRDNFLFFPGLAGLEDRVARLEVIEDLKQDGAKFLQCMRDAGRPVFGMVDLEQVDTLLESTLQFNPRKRSLVKAIAVLANELCSTPRRVIVIHPSSNLDIARNEVTGTATLTQAIRAHVKRHLEQGVRSREGSWQRSMAYRLATEYVNDAAHWHLQGCADTQLECLRLLENAARQGNKSSQSLVYRFYLTFGCGIPDTLLDDIKKWLIVTTELGYPAAVEDLPAVVSPEVFNEAVQALRSRRNGLRRTRFEGFHQEDQRINVKAVDTGCSNIFTAPENVHNIREFLYTFTNDAFLHFAAATGLYETVLAWLRLRPEDVNYRGEKKETPLLLACRSGHHKIALALLKNGADPTFANDDGDTPLHWLISFDDDQMEKMADTLYKRGGDPNALAKGISFASAPLCNFPSGTPLHRAICRGKLLAVKALLRVGAKVDIAQPDTGCTPLFLAVRLHYPEIVEVLLAGRGNSSALDVNNRSLLIPAIIGEYEHGQNFSKIARHGPQWWHRAQKTLELLMQQDGGVLHIHNLPGMPNCNALSLASDKGDVNVVEYLLKNGALVDLNVETNIDNNHEKCTPLLSAIRKARKEIFSLLLQHGADTTALILQPDGEALTLLHECVLANHESTYFAEKLLNAGVEVDARPAGYESPFATAVRCRCFALAKLFLERGADPHVEFSRGLMVQSDYACSLIGYLILEQALSALPCIGYLLGLLDKSPRFTISKSKGYTVLHLVAAIPETGRDNVACCAILRRLLDHFSPNETQVNQEDSSGRTALQYAVSASNVEVVALLFKHGARWDVKTLMAWISSKIITRTLRPSWSLPPVLHPSQSRESLPKTEGGSD